MILDPNEYGREVFEPVKEFSFLVNIPGVPSYTIKSISELKYTYNDQKDRMEWAPVTVTFYTAVELGLEKILLDTVGHSGLIPTVEISNLSACGNIGSIIVLRDSQVLSLNFGARAYEAEGLTMITLTFKPKWVNTK